MNKPLCLATMLLLTTSSLHSQLAHADQVNAALTECRQQQNALKRLVCYDEIKVDTAVTSTNSAVQTHSQAPVRPAAASSRPTPAVTAAPAQNDFGLEHKKAADKETDQLYLTVSSISYSPRKELIVGFDNGQTWRQTGRGNYQIAVGERHYIKRGMLNSFSLGNDDNNRTIKVRRVE
ncbi:hypothetical protein [Arsukibacterium perlucidum]|uniref:hypothetical protein n=1 Tax=Arsukibacterium perlucidum TaxID=368811 RepID=UPI00036C3DFE|nr:hypothetical protein [Arsukibacterium perlucidum]